jgi:tetratricopeptide (TPR) repeat protein
MSTTARLENDNHGPTITMDWIKEMEGYLNTANLDGALKFIAGIQPLRLGEEMDPQLDDFLQMRVRCLICEVFDYAGKYKEANLCLGRHAEDALSSLEAAALDTAEIWQKKERRQLQKLKQECLMCLHFGMVTYYRNHKYREALEVFTRARDILAKLDQQTSVGSKGSMAHASYFMGLAAREQYNFYDARMYFSEAVELAWKRILEEQQRGEGRVGYLKYIVGRSLGLGMAWIAFVRASMSEANAHIIAARIILQDSAGVKYLRDYVEVVHACTQRSRATTIPEIHAAIEAMKVAYRLLGGDEALKLQAGAADQPIPEDSGHCIYAQRAAAELATSHIYAARLHGRKSQQAREVGSKVENDDELAARYEAESRSAIEESARHLQESEKYLALVSDSLPYTDPQNRDIRTRCNIYIAKSRIGRERGDGKEAVDQADRAVRIAGDNPFSRIDCWTTRGEAYFFKGETAQALQQFRKARHDSHAQMNPKVLAVCDLHTALCHLKQKEFRVAEEILARWRSQGRLGRHNAFVQYLEAEVMSQLSQAAFIIPAESASLNMDDWTEELKDWLEQAALRRAGNDEQMALDILGRRTMRKSKSRNGSTEKDDVSGAG